MAERVLVTGGAGFIGSHLTDALLALGHEVVVIDSLEPQVHLTGAPPSYLSRAVEFVHGDIRDERLLKRALDRVDVIFHLAALVGVGQSMYEIRRYVDANSVGTATILQALADAPGMVRKLVVASSMSIYGEGAYTCVEHGMVSPDLRPERQLAERLWEVRCPACQTSLRPIPTPERKPIQPTSIYAINKRDQEELSLVFGRAYRLPTVALRFFNVYGSRQTLGNPYTGVAAIVCSRIINGQPPLIYEDGLQSRDFTHVADIIQGCLLAMTRSEADYGVFNLGTGEPQSVLAVARALGDALGRHITPEIAGIYRAGDIRHCYADLALSRSTLGFRPSIAFSTGVEELVSWVSGQQAGPDRVAQAAAELARRGLTR